MASGSALHSFQPMMGSDLEVSMDMPKIPEKRAELVELEERHGTIRVQRREIEAELRKVETELSRLAAREDSALDEIAEQLASGKIKRISTSNLPDRRDDLRAQLEIVVRSDQKVTQRLARERERHNNRIVAAFRPAHQASVRRIAGALAELVAANAAEHEVRKAAPVQLVAMSFPNVGGFDANNAGPAGHWRQYAERLGYFEDDERELHPKPIAGKGSG
jgi:septal ring factor EnvC (AmiA/AmiB activator)